MDTRESPGQTPPDPSRWIDPPGATVRYNRSMFPAAPDVRRWLEGFEAARFADQAARRAAGPMIERSIRLSLSLLQAARAAAGGKYPVDPRRSAEGEAVQRTWNRLRAAYVR